jgi:hypothetical protein
MNELLNGLLKKDEDLTVIYGSEDTLVVESEIFAQPESPIEPERPTELPMSVRVRVIRVIACVNVICSLLIMIGGIIPYYLLKKDSIPELWWLFGTLTCISIILYVLMYVIKDQFFSVPIAGVWMFLVFMIVNTLAAIMRNLAPFQAIAIIFAQNTALLVYCFLSRRNVDIVWAAGFMGCAGFVAWLCGLYIFIQDNDWVVAGLLFLFFVIGCPAYCVNQLRYIDRFNVSTEDLIKAVIYYYTDALFGPIRWMNNFRSPQ